MSKAMARNLLPTSPTLPLLESLTTTAQLKQTHAHIITTGYRQHGQTSTEILRICALATHPDSLYARLLFDQIQFPNTFTWNCLLRAYSKTTSPNQTISLYKDLFYKGTSPSGITFSFVIKACSHLKSSRFLMGIHGQLLSLGFHSDVLVLNSLIHGYSSCGSVDFARAVFDELPERDLISWTEVIHGYVRTNRAKEAVDLFFLMMEERVRPDEITVVAVFTACSQLGDLSLGRKVASLAFKIGVRSNTHVVNSLIDMYAKCGSISEARDLFDRMVHKDVVSWNSMVAGYSRSGDMEAAKRLFNQIPDKNEVSWSSLINGYVQNGDFKEAVSVFHEMSGMGVPPNEAAITGIITTCTHLGILDLGRKIHLNLDESKVQSDVVLSTALVDMYVKCGDLETACALFDRIANKNLVSWNVMLMGLAIHGKASECLEIFSEMLRVGLRPDSMSFVGVLSACAYAGWLKEGMDNFTTMTVIYGISPRAEHCSCVVHLMGRAGLIAKACDFIRASAVEPDVATLGALLSACKVHGYLELGEFIAERILELDPCHSGAYVQLSSMYASANKWREVVRLRKRMKDSGIRNRKGWSWFELDGTIHEFLVGVNSHPRIKDVHSLLHAIEVQMSSTHSMSTA